MVVIDFFLLILLFLTNIVSPPKTPRFPPEPPTLLGVVGDCWIEKKGVMSHLRHK